MEGKPFRGENVRGRLCEIWDIGLEAGGKAAAARDSQLVMFLTVVVHGMSSEGDKSKSHDDIPESVATTTLLSALVCTRHEDSEAQIIVRLHKHEDIM